MIINLSPYEKDRIVPEAFGQTEMGRDLLAQDYLLKQITASLLYPEGETGKQFWKRIYALAQEKYGTTDIPVDTFNKVWIVPEKAVVYENGKVGAAYVTESRLKVMLESDYLATEQNGVIPQSANNDTQEIVRNVLREVVIPVLEKEVNESQNFVRLRQVYLSLILAVWYKRKIMDTLLHDVYANADKVSGIASSETNLPERIWGEYVKSFRKGVFELIREEDDKWSEEMIPRKYFSGGVKFGSVDLAMTPRIMIAGRFMTGLFLMAVGLGAQEHSSFTANEGIVGETPVEESISLQAQAESNVPIKEDVDWLKKARSNSLEVLNSIQEWSDRSDALDIMKKIFYGSSQTTHMRESVDKTFSLAEKFPDLEWINEFWRGVAVNEPNILINRLGEWDGRLSPAREALIVKLLVDVSPQSLLECVHFYRYQVPVHRWLEAQDTPRANLVRKIGHGNLGWPIKQKMAIFISAILSGDLNEEQAEKIAGNDKEIVNWAFQILRDPSKLYMHDQLRYFMVHKLILPWMDYNVNMHKNEIALLNSNEILMIMEAVYLRGQGQYSTGDINLLFDLLVEKMTSESRPLSDLVFSDRNGILNELVTEWLKHDRFQTLLRAPLPSGGSESFFLLRKLIEPDLGDIRAMEKFGLLLFSAKSILADSMLTEADRSRIEQIMVDYQGQLRTLILGQVNESQNVIPYIKMIPDNNDLWAMAEKMLRKKLAEHMFFDFSNRFELINKEWGQEVLRQAIMNDPKEAIKRHVYISSARTVIPGLQDLLVALDEIKKNASNSDIMMRAALLTQEVATGNLTWQQALGLVAQPLEFRKHLKKLLEDNDYPSARSIQYEIDDASLWLRILVKINELHNANDTVRFASVETASASDLYWLLVRGEDEVFTSTFRGLFARMIERMKVEGLSGYAVVADHHVKDFRVFFRMLARFGKTNEFFATMTLDQQKKLINDFVENIGQANDGLQAAVVAADTFFVISDHNLLRQIQLQIKDMYEQANESGNKQSMVLYGLLASVLKDKAIVHKEWFESVAKEYPLPKLDELSRKELFDEKGRNVQRYFFYDDEDGSGSYVSFIAKYTNNPNWSVRHDKNKTFATIASTKGERIVIYANRPDKMTEGNEAIDELFDAQNIKPAVIVHRGHSYHLNDTLDELAQYGKSVVFVGLGSCGGYNNIDAVLDYAPGAHISSTKGIGQKAINDPLLYEINQMIRTNGVVNWSKVWGAIKGKVGGIDGFVDYISPSENLSVVFSRAYHALMADDSAQMQGGIDFNSDRMELMTRNSGQKIYFHMDPAQLQQMHDAAGFAPVIINVQPMSDLRLFLGLQASDIEAASAG